MLSVVPKFAPWPYQRSSVGVDGIEKVATEVGNWTSLISFTPQFTANDNQMAIPGSPITVYDSLLNKLPIGAYDGVTYPAPATIGRSYVAIQSVAGKAWLSQDKGQTWALKSTGTYNVGAIFRFKNWMMFSNSPFIWETRELSQNFNAPGTNRSGGNTAGSPAIAAFGAKNANCIVTSGNHTSTAPIMYVAWTYPNFIAYDRGAEQAQPYYYLGNNIFYTKYAATTRFFYVPPTQGVPVLLQTKATSIVTRVEHVRNQVFFVKGNGAVMAAPLAAVVENPAITVGAATTYLQTVLAAIEGQNTQQLLEPGSAPYAFRWGFDRFVFMTRRGAPLVSTTHIWEVKVAKPSVKFTVKAGITGNSSQGSTGFALANGQYGYGGAHGQLISPPSEPDVQVLICSDWRNPDNLYPYGGFGLLLNLEKTALLARFVAVKVNGRTFSFDSLEVAECRAFTYPGGVGTLCNWMLDLAEFVNGQTYVVELIPR